MRKRKSLRVPPFALPLTVENDAADHGKRCNKPQQTTQATDGREAILMTLHN